MVLFGISLVLATGTLSGCTGSTPVDPGSNTVSAAPGDESVALGLVNLWRVTGAAGETADTWLRIDADVMILWRPCGGIDYAWAAADAQIITEPTGYSMGCGAGAIRPPAATWLDDATEFRADTGGWQLLDFAGHTVATLTIDGAPQPSATLADEYAKPPIVTEQTRQALLQPQPLPDGFTPATIDTLLGTWKPVGEYSTDPHVTFSADQNARASDGCNGTLTRWTALDNGRFLATVGGMTDIGCDGAPVPEWVSTAAYAGFADGQLVLFDAPGAELCRLDRG